MNQLGYLSKIIVYPFKSLEGVAIESSTFTSGGALKWDRRWKLIDEHDNVINSKVTDQLISVNTNWNIKAEQVSFESEVGDFTIGFTQLNKSSEYFSELFKKKVWVKECSDLGFPDDEKYPGPTIVGTQSITELAKAFPDISFEEWVKRLRVNLLIELKRPFEEDLWLDQFIDPVLSLGEQAKLELNNYCQRCNVPAKNPTFAKFNNEFRREFTDYRQRELEGKVSNRFFNHFYRICINTTLREKGEIHLGDSVNW